uniref:Uncharacterized protein n=1 Tax=Rhizophora mucronata TaxID=61149 RepID=A0A2P2R537_RHIMU
MVKFLATNHSRFPNQIPTAVFHS